MRKWILVILFGIFLSFQSCKKLDCTEINCFTPPQPFIFESLDKSSNENLFTNGRYDSTQIEVFNSSDSSRVNYVFVGKDSINLVSIYGIGWERNRTQSNVSMVVSGQYILNLFVDSESETKDCCTNTNYYEIRIDSANFEKDLNSGVYKILID